MGNSVPRKTQGDLATAGIGPHGASYKRSNRRTQHFAPPTRSGSNPGAGGGNPGTDVQPPPPPPPATPPFTLTYSGCKDTFVVDFSGPLPGVKRYLVQHGSSNTGPWVFYCYQRRQRTKITFNNYFGGTRWVRIQMIAFNGSATDLAIFQPDPPNVAPPTLSVPGLHAPTFPMPTAYTGAAGGNPAVGVLVSADLESLGLNSTPLLKIPCDAAIFEATKLEYLMEDFSGPQSPSTMAVTVTGPAGSTVKFTTDGTQPTALLGNNSGTVISPYVDSFGCVVIARAFKDGCKSPPLILCIDKNINFLTRFRTEVYAILATQSCDLANLQRSPNEQGICQVGRIERGCYSLYQTDNPTAIFAAFEQAQPNGGLSGGALDRIVFVSDGGATITGATVDPATCGPGSVWTEGTLHMTASSQTIGKLTTNIQTDAAANLAAFPNSFSLVTLKQKSDQPSGTLGPMADTFLDALASDFFGPTRAVTGFTHTDFVGSTNGSCIEWLFARITLAIEFLSKATPFYISSLRIACSLASTFSVDIWDQDDVISPPASGGTPPPAPDLIPPVATITSPSAGATLTGNANVVVTASDDVGVDHTSFFVDGVQVATNSGGNHTYVWDSTTVVNGSHDLEAKAFDAAGNVGISDPVTIITSNLLDPTADPDLFMWVSSDTGITKDGGDHMVSSGCWTDRSGQGHNLDGANLTFTTWLANQVNGHPAISFNNSYLSNPGGVTNLAAPHTVYLLVNIPAWSSNKYLIDGTGGADGALILNGSSPVLQQYGGNFGAAVNLSFGTWLILTSVWNGSSSTLEINNLGAQTGNAGTTVPHRVVLGGYAGGGGSNATFLLAACIVSNAANDSTIQTLHKHWLAAYGGLTI